jgi:hypothetical protein
MTLQQVISWVLGNLEFVIIGLVLLSTVFNFIGGAGKAMREGQERAEREAEMRRTGGERERQAREANPDTQSYQGYLERTRQPDATLERQTPPSPPSPPARPNNTELKDLQAEILEALGMKGAQNPPPFAGPTDPQADLRRQLAEKMGRSTPPPPPRQTPRPPPRPQPAPRKPIESQIEVYLDDSRPERLERDSVPDTMGYSRRQPSQKLPTRRPEDEGSTAYKGEGGVAVIQRPEGVNQVRGIGTQAQAAANASALARRIIDPRNAAQGVMWAEILGKPRAKQGRRRF